MCFILAFFILATSLYVSSNRIVIEYALKSFNSAISSASYYAIDKIVDEEYSYEDIVKIKTDDQGQISMVAANGYQVNKIAAVVAENAFNYLSKEVAKGAEVPIGAFTGFRLFSGFGKRIPMKVVSISSVKCNMVSEFQQAGINQTRHSLYLKINCEASVVTKTQTKEVSDQISVLVFDNLIVGKVPNVLLTPLNVGSGEKKQ